MKRRTTIAARVAALLAVLLSTLVANMGAQARVTSINLSSTAVASAPDYASVTYSDPWDYSNNEDQLLDQFAGTLSLSSPRIGLGFFSFETNNGASFDPVRTIGGAEPTGRDSALHPIDASRFTRLSMRINSNSLENAGVLWFNCPTAVGTCAGGFPFQIKPGWQTYDFDIPAQTRFGSLPLTWSGMLSGLRIIPTNSAGRHFDFDWIRLYQSTPSVTITWIDNNPGAAADLYWDSDTDPGNNSANNPGWGLVQHVASTSANNTTSFVSAAFPPGTYYFYVKDLGDSTISAVSQGLMIDGIPLPVVDQPDLAGGEDYATAVRGDAWDFSSPSDAALRNVQNVWYAGGILNATNGPPSRNDPQAQMAMGAPIDGNRYHRLTFGMYYDGAFGLEDAPGGGTHARVIWKVAGSNAFQESRELVTFQGSNVLSYDLRRSPSNAINEESQSGAKIGWAGYQISEIRFDPNEDPGTRGWHLDFVRIAADDGGSDNFDVVFHDNAWEAGTTADIFADDDASGFNGVQIASGLPVVQGQNTFHWNDTKLPTGAYYIWIRLRDARSTSQAYSTGPVQITPKPINAYGAFAGGVNVAGAQLDADAVREIVTGAGAGGGPHVRTFEPSGAPLASFFPYPGGFRGGVNVAAGNLDGASSDEIITGAGPGGGPHVRVFRSDGTPIGGGFMAYDSGFRGGVYVAAGNVDGAPGDEIITGAGPGGGPHVRVWRFDTTTGVATELFGFMAYSAGFQGGVRVGAGNIDGAGRTEIITGAGPGGGPHVRVRTYDPSTRVLGEMFGYFPYPVGFTGGVFVGAGDVNGDGRDEVITGADAGGGAHVLVRDLSGAFLSSSFPYPHSGGVRVGSANIDGAGGVEILTGPGPGYRSDVYAFRPF